MTVGHDVSDVKEMRYHRVKFYPHTYSNFDSIEPCPTGPGKSCWGCTNGHPHCDKDGRTDAPAKK